MTTNTETEKAIIDKYLGRAYVHEGRTIEGLDCFGLVILVYKEHLGIDLFDITGLNPEWHVKGGNHIVDNYWRDWKRVRDPKFLDGVTFQNYKGISNHGGLMLRGTKFIHCARKVGVTVGDITDKVWAKRISGFYRHKTRCEHDQY